MILSLEMRVAVRCKACSVLTPMPGIRNQLSCRGCAASIDFAAKAADARDGGLRYPFGGCYDAVAEAALLLEEGQDCKDARDSQGSSVALRRALPQCGACSAMLPTPAPGALDLTCPQCADTVAVRWPDDETRSWDPRIYCVLGDGKGRGDAPAPHAGDAAHIKCGHCGAPSKIDPGERKRARTCTHCGGVNYLSDAAWLGLFPLPEWHRSHLLYSIDERGLLSLHLWMDRQQDSKYFLEPERKAALVAGRERAAVAARGALVEALMCGAASHAEIELLSADPALDDAQAAVIDAGLDDRAREARAPEAADALVRRWVGSTEPKIRRLVAAHSALGAAALEGLASDPDEGVRVIVAGRTETPTTVLALLRKDPSERVANAVKANPSHQPGFFEKLFG